ncbi:MAG: PH domain-containing protein [Thermomonas sp.]
MPTEPTLEPAVEAIDAAEGWHPPPSRAVRLHATAIALLLGVIALTAMAAPLLASDTLNLATRIAIALAVSCIAAALGAYVGARLRHQRWKLDAEGLWLRQGRLWLRETRVPASRVQHVDIKHGPLERRFKLATLVVHTAAAQLSGITVRGLDQADAQRLRDALAQQLDEAGDAL